MRHLRLTLLLFALLSGGVVSQAADAFDAMRLRWRDLLAGGDDCDTNNLHIRFALLSISRDTNYFHTNFWSNLPATNDSAGMTTAFNRICAMARAYATRGSACYSNAGLAADIISALDWMYANRYNESASETGNWWDWEIGSPMALADTCVLVYDLLTPARLNNYMNVVNRFSPTPVKVGANLVWKARVVAVRGALVKDPVKLGLARDALTQVFEYVSEGDGFYADGSFIQHAIHPYTGGYGESLLDSVSLLLPWLNSLTNQSWNVVDPDQTNVINWVFDSYEPLLYRGAFMDMVRGREISRPASTDHAIGHLAIQAILRLAQWTNSPRMKSMVKYWAQSDTALNFLNSAPLPLIPALEQLLADATIPPRGELLGHYQFPAMARVAHWRPGWGLGIAMSSSHIANYESLNNENLHGWYTGAGMTFLYNSDLSQFCDGFWPTIDPYRLPGTTVGKVPRADASGQSYLSSKNWVGGAALFTNGVAGMTLDAWSSGLTAKKSWFCFGREVVCLGAAIKGSDPFGVETIVENRKLTSYGDNPLTVNGQPAIPGPPSSAPGGILFSNASWAHLAGNLPGADVGYYFPSPVPLKALRQVRTSTNGWFAIDESDFTRTNPISRNYLTLWLDHGSNPDNAAYSYVLLPGFSASQVSNYAANPPVVVLTNAARAQAVKETLHGITAVNFWTDTLCAVGGITASQKCSVILQNNGTLLDIAVSDPTQTNTGTLYLLVDGIHKGATSLAADPGVVVLQSSPKILLSVNVRKAAGRTFRASFFVGPTPGHQPPAVALTDPSDGARFGAPATFALSGDPEASGSTVTNLTFFSGPTNLARLAGPPYTLPISNLPAGRYTYTAVATESAGLMATSAPVAITVINPPFAHPTNLALPWAPSVDVDLWSLAGDPQTPSSNLIFAVTPPTSGRALLLADLRTARFIPLTNGLATSTFAYSVTDPAPDSRQLLQYDFEPPDTANDSMVRDSSGSGRDGRLSAFGGGGFAYTNTSPFPAFSASSLQLLANGANGAARLTRDLDEISLSDHSWSFGAWFLRAATNTEDFILYVGAGDGHGGSGDELELFGATDGSVRLAHFNILGLQDVLLASAPLPPSNQWHHVAITFDRTNSFSGFLRFYADGCLLAQPTNVAWALDQSPPLVFGGHGATNSNVDRYFSGLLDDLILFTNCLSDAEVSRLASRPAAYFAGTTASNFISITLNRPPSLQPLVDVVTNAGATLLLTNAAADPDLPPQTFTFTLLTNPPPPLGASLDPGTGIFTWRPFVAQADTTNQIALAVTDSGLPPLSATQSFRVIVTPLSPSRVSAGRGANGQLQLIVNGPGHGPDYTVQASTDLNHWIDLVTTNSPSLPFSWIDPSAPSHGWRFYRVLPGP